jgi:hypothetical protein
MPEDREAIRELVHAYAVGCDLQDLELLASLFAPGSVIEVRWPSGHTHSMTMPDDVSVLARLSRFDDTFHDLGTHWVRLDGAGARAVTYCTAHHIRDDLDSICGVRYDDNLLRTDGGWKFVRRDETIVWTDRRALQPHSLGHDPAQAH